MAERQRDDLSIGRDSVSREMALAFPLEHIDLPFEGLRFRPLDPADLKSLFEILGDDPEMTWPRRPWNEADVREVLEMRLSHYRRHSFGVYAVERDEDLSLIGMAGLQFWNESSPDVELVAYIRRSCWNRGIATRLLQVCVDRAFERTSLLPRIVAATRHDNPAAQKMIASLGLEPRGDVIHFGWPSKFWAIDRSCWESRMRSAGGTST